MFIIINIAKDQRKNKK